MFRTALLARRTETVCKVLSRRISSLTARRHLVVGSPASLYPATTSRVIPGPCTCKALFSSKFTMDQAWKPPVPCKVGDALRDIDTPALLIDLDSMEYNLETMTKLMQQWPNVVVRPHVKAHKCPAIADLQMKYKACGICCQTLTEAEAMVYGANIQDVFLTNQLIGKPKLRRFVALAKKAPSVSICVDNMDNIKDIDEVAREAGVTIALVVEVNVGQDRCGVEPGEPPAVLAEEIGKLSNVYFKGLHCYQGSNQHIRKAGDRGKAVASVVGMVKDTLQALEAKGIACDYVTGGGTGTFPYEAGSGVYTEVQPGSYIVMDVDYCRNYGEDGQFIHDFKHSLFVLTTVQSVMPGHRAVVDAGMKAVSMDSGVPMVVEHPDLTYIIGGDEHGILKPSGDLKVGDILKLVPGHCDPTVNLYDWIIGVRQGKVESVWPVLGRGPGV